MLTLSNGHTFSIACAAGALAFGRGYWWERYGLIPFGVIDPSLFTCITKTITRQPRRGNLRWWSPCVWPLSDGGTVNAVGLTNPGMDWLVEEYYAGNFPVQSIPTIVSVMAETTAEAEQIGRILDPMGKIKGIELNISCPNTTVQAKAVDVFLALKASTTHPVGVKIGYHDDHFRLCQLLDGQAAWFDAINTISWARLHDKPSPLVWWGHEGGVSGPEITQYARGALRELAEMGLQTPLISGGGIFSAQEALWRLENGAGAITLGTLFLTRPWKVNAIARACRNKNTQSY